MTGIKKHIPQWALSDAIDIVSRVRQSPRDDIRVYEYVASVLMEIAETSGRTPETVVDELRRRLKFHRAKAVRAHARARDNHAGIQYWKTKYMEEAAKNEDAHR